MLKRDVVKLALAGEEVPYVPWSCSFTLEAHEKLARHFGREEYDDVVNNHFCRLKSYVGLFEPVGNERYRDIFGVIWNRETDKDIGVIEGQVLPQPTLKGFQMPDPLDGRLFENIEQNIAANKDLFRIFPIGFSLYERAWTLRGMENLMMDFYENPDFVHELFTAIADYNIAQVRHALEYDIDAVYFGDDWGQQHGLLMGPKLWHEFIEPQLRRMYGIVREAGKYVFIHSCGDVDELFDCLIDCGLNCFNPFQPEVMDVFELLERYRGRLAFHGGLSTQKTLPFGSTADVAADTRKLIEAGMPGGYVFFASSRCGRRCSFGKPADVY